MYGNRTPPETPPCGTCRVELLKENEEAANVYMLTRQQVIMMQTDKGPRPIDISIPAIKDVMDIYGVQDQRGCLLKVRKVFHHFESQRGGE
jgi:hypothetical protein